MRLGPICSGSTLGPVVEPKPGSAPLYHPQAKPCSEQPNANIGFDIL